MGGNVLINVRHCLLCHSFKLGSSCLEKLWYFSHFGHNILCNATQYYEIFSEDVLGMTLNYYHI